jgi:hypothetical protein
MEPHPLGSMFVVDGNAAVAKLRVDLASPQVQKYLARRLSSCITQHLHTTVLRPLTVYRSKTGYVAGESGAALHVISIAMAIYFWRRRDEVEGHNRQAPTYYGQISATE